MMHPKKIALKSIQQKIESELEEADFTVRDVLKDLVMGFHIKDYDLTDEEKSCLEATVSYNAKNQMIDVEVLLSAKAGDEDKPYILPDDIPEREYSEDSYSESLMPATLAYFQHRESLEVEYSEGAVLQPQDVRALKCLAQDSVNELYEAAEKKGLGWCPTCKPQLLSDGKGFVVGV